MRVFKLKSLLICCGVVFILLTGNMYAQESISSLLKQIELGEPQHYRSLTVVPILTKVVTNNFNFLTLEQALEKNLIEITELEGGSVPQVKIKSLADEPIYIMGGEVLTGCKQDRMVGKDILIKPNNKQVIVPVFCVEQSRWSYQSDKFYSKENAATSNLRAEAQNNDGRAQGKIWNQVHKMNEKMGVSTDTNAYQDAYEDEEVMKQIKQYEAELINLPRKYTNMVGILVVVGEKIISVDIFANTYLFKALWPKLLKSSIFYTLYAEEGRTFKKKDAELFLDKLTTKKYTERAAVDWGRELSLLDEELNVNALIYQNAIVHLAAFPYEESEISYQTHGSQFSVNQIDDLQHTILPNLPINDVTR